MAATGSLPEAADPTSPVFGVPLAVAVERTPSYDGVQLPVIVRECIDYIEEHGKLVIACHLYDLKENRTMVVVSTSLFILT